MNVVHLHGELERFGGPYELAVTSPREAVIALARQLPDFEKAMLEGEFNVVRLKDGKAVEIDDELVELGMDDAELHITPAIRGADGKSIAKIIAGVVLVGVGLFTGQMWIVAAGVGILAAGVSTMLMPSPKAGDPNDREKQKASFLFNGPVNVSEQGHPLPLVYGRVLAGSIVGSADLLAELFVLSGTSFDGTPQYTGAVGYDGAGGIGGMTVILPNGYIDIGTEEIGDLYPNYPDAGVQLN